MNNSDFDTNLSEKELLRRNVRDALTNKKPAPGVLDMSSVVLEPVDNPLVSFVDNFRAAGGKFIPCTKANLVQRLVKLIEGQNYSQLLNTSPNLAKFLVKYNVNFVNAVNPFYPADAILAFSDMVIARSGSIGLRQDVARYATVKNMAKDLIVVTRDVCIFSELEDAISYQKKRGNGTQPAIMEFISPTTQKASGVEEFQPTSPRIILMMVAESFEQNEKNADNKPADESQN